MKLEKVTPKLWATDLGKLPYVKNDFATHTFGDEKSVMGGWFFFMPKVIFLVRYKRQFYELGLPYLFAYSLLHGQTRVKYFLKLIEDSNKSYKSLNVSRGPGRKPFRFLNYMIDHVEFISTVYSCWNKNVQGCYVSVFFQA